MLVFQNGVTREIRVGRGRLEPAVTKEPSDEREARPRSLYVRDRASDRQDQVGDDHSR